MRHFMITDCLNKPISEIKYNFKSQSDIHLISEPINLFDIKEKMLVFETINDIIFRIKFVYEKSMQKIIQQKIERKYGKPTYFYDVEKYEERELSGDFTNWNIKKWKLIPYEKKELNFAENNVWKTENFLVKLLNFSTIRGFNGDYVYLNFTQLKS